MKIQTGARRNPRTRNQTEEKRRTGHRSPHRAAGPHLHHSDRTHTLLTSAANKAGAAIGSVPELVQAYKLIADGNKLPDQRTRALAESEEAVVRGRLDRLRQATADKYIRAGQRASNISESIMAVLRSASTKKQTIRFEDPESMRVTYEAVSQFVQRGAPVNLVLPIGGGKAANPLKTGESYLPDLSEHTSAIMLAAIADAIREIYTPGAHVFMVPDAGLHSDDLGMSATEHALHLRRFAQDLVELGVDRQVSMVDTLALLPDQWADEVTVRSAATRGQVAVDPIMADSVNAQVRSLQYSLNLRIMGWSYEDVVQAMMALAVPTTPDLRTAAKERALTILQRTREVAARYVGTNHALRSLDLPSHVMAALTGDPSYVRLTVHAKPGEPRPSLFPSSSVARPGLLPMHGVGVWDWREDKVRAGATFHLEARMRGHVAVQDKYGRVLFYEPSA